MKTELPADTVEKINKFRGLLQKVVKKKDLITDEEIETVEGLFSFSSDGSRPCSRPCKPWHG